MTTSLAINVYTAWNEINGITVSITIAANTAFGNFANNNVQIGICDNKITNLL